jgi:LmbE family N-acetylglucosaminyl deacetylase
MITRIARLFAAALIASMALSAGLRAVPGATPGVEPAPLVLGRERAMVISPHPDDATLAAGGLIQQVIRNGGAVQVVQMTSGDGFPRGVSAMHPRLVATPVAYRSYASTREREAIGAMRVLSVPRSQIRLLGFPDEGLCELASAFRAGRVFESPYTKRDAPPAPERIVRGTRYRGDDLIRELARLIQAFRPTLVVFPHCGDLHPDHCATHLLTHDALAYVIGRGLRPPRLLHYVVHFPDWPSGDPTGGVVQPPTGELARDLTWVTLPLGANARANKRRALERFRSQMLVMPDFLGAFVRANELFIAGEPRLPIPCWCSGEDIAAPRAVH